MATTDLIRPEPTGFDDLFRCGASDETYGYCDPETGKALATGVREREPQRPAEAAPRLRQFYETVLLARSATCSSSTAPPRRSRDTRSSSCAASGTSASDRPSVPGAPRWRATSRGGRVAGPRLAIMGAAAFASSASSPETRRRRCSAWKRRRKPWRSCASGWTWTRTSRSSSSCGSRVLSRDSWAVFFLAHRFWTRTRAGCRLPEPDRRRPACAVLSRCRSESAPRRAASLHGPGGRWPPPWSASRSRLRAWPRPDRAVRVALERLPVSGYVPLSRSPAGFVQHLILPALALGTPRERRSPASHGAHARGARRGLRAHRAGRGPRRAAWSDGTLSGQAHPCADRRGKLGRRAPRAASWSRPSSTCRGWATRRSWR